MIHNNREIKGLSMNSSQKRWFYEVFQGGEKGKARGFMKLSEVNDEAQKGR